MAVALVDDDVGEDQPQDGTGSCHRGPSSDVLASVDEVSARQDRAEREQRDERCEQCPPEMRTRYSLVGEKDD